MIWEAELCIIFTSFCFADHCYVRAGWETRNYHGRTMAWKSCCHHGRLHGSPISHLAPRWSSRNFPNTFTFVSSFRSLRPPGVPCQVCIYLSMVDLGLIQYFIIREPCPPPITFLLWLVGGWWYYQCQDQNSKIKNICKYNAFNIFQKISLYWLPSEFPRHPQPLHCKSPTCFSFSSNSPNVTKLRLLRPWHRRLSAFLTFLFSLWLLGRVAQLLHSQCHHALSKTRLFQRAKRLYCTVVTFVSSDFGSFINSSHNGISLDGFVHLCSSSFLCVDWPSVKDREDQKQRLPRSPIGYLFHLFLHWIHIWCRLKSGYANYASAYIIVSAHTGSYWPIRLILAKQILNSGRSVLFISWLALAHGVVRDPRMCVSKESKRQTMFRDVPPCLACLTSCPTFRSSALSASSISRSCSRFCLAEATDKMSSVMSSWYSLLGLGIRCMPSCPSKCHVEGWASNLRFYDIDTYISALLVPFSSSLQHPTHMSSTWRSKPARTM